MSAGTEPEAVTLTSPDGELVATFRPGAGMVGSSLRFRGEELLAQRRGLSAYLEQGSTFALPLLYPWANRLSGWDYRFDGVEVQLERDSPLIHTDPGQGVPMHGLLAAGMDWQLRDVAPAELRAELDWGADPRRLAIFPFPHRLVLLASVADGRLSVSLTIIPTSERAVPVCFGFHPYLTLPGSDRRDWHLTLPVRDGALDGPLGERSFDDGFTELSGEPPIFSIADARRRLSIVFVNYPVAQVFAPPESDFVAIEPMTAPTDALRSGRGPAHVQLAHPLTGNPRVPDPGETYSATFHILVEDVAAESPALTAEIE